MGGRGASSGGGGGGGGSLVALLKKYSEEGGGSGATTGQKGSALFLAPFQTNNDYTDNNNPQLLKWQQQPDNDKRASFLAKVDNQTDLSQIQSQTGDQYAFHDLPYQRFVSTLGLNGKPTVLSDSDFDNYVKQTGATVLYRGWSGKNSATRFTESPNSHVGNGINGDGYYFAPNKSTAMGYGKYGTKAALSPNARVVSMQTLNNQIKNLGGSKYSSALSKAGSYGTRTYGPNLGQAQVALSMGYNVIDAGWAVIPLTRDAVVTTKTRQW